MDSPWIIPEFSCDYPLLICCLSLDYPQIIPRYSLDYPLITLRFSLYHNEVIPVLSFDYPKIFPEISRDYPLIILGLSLDFPRIIHRLSKDYLLIFPSLYLDYPGMIPRLKQARASYCYLETFSLFFSPTGSIEELALLKMMSSLLTQTFLPLDIFSTIKIKDLGVKFLMMESKEMTLKKLIITMFQW